MAVCVHVYGLWRSLTIWIQEIFREPTSWPAESSRSSSTVCPISHNQMWVVADNHEGLGCSSQLARHFALYMFILRFWFVNFWFLGNVGNALRRYQWIGVHQHHEADILVLVAFIYHILCTSRWRGAIRRCTVEVCLWVRFLNYQGLGHTTA